MIAAKHCIRSINILMIVDVNFLHFIHSFISLYVKMIAHNDITINSVSTVVFITIPPLLYEVHQLAILGSPLKVSAL